MHPFVRTLTRFRSAASIGTLALVAALAGCGSDSSTGSGTGKVSILLKDAPGDVEHAVVTILQIYLQGSNGRVVLRNTPVTTDLLTLANSTAQLVQDASVPAGTYSELRFVISGGYIEVDNGSGGSTIYASSSDYAGLPQGAHVDGTLQMPSLAQSGLKVKLPSDQVEIQGDQKVLLVDFDVSRSFGQQAGNSGRWVMHPVLEATDFTTTGGLTVSLAKADSVTLPDVNGQPTTLASFSAVITQNTDSGPSVHTLAFTDAGNGTAQAHFQYLVPGTYSVDLQTPTGMTVTTNETRPATVQLASGQEATTSFTLSSALVQGTP